MDVGTQNKGKFSLLTESVPFFSSAFFFSLFFVFRFFSFVDERERAVTRTHNADERTARRKEREREREREREKKKSNRNPRGCVCLLTLAQFCERMHRKE